MEGSRRRRVRAQRSALLYVLFPAGTPEDAIKETAAEFGIEDYELVTESDGSLSIRRADIADGTEVVKIKVGDGKVVGISRSEFTTPAPQESLPAIAVIELEFKKEKFSDTEAVMSYLKRYDIDFLEKGVENGENTIRVVRSEVEGQDTRRVEVEEGVTAIVARSATPDVSSSMVEIVSETAYGNWGWGQLDFAAAIADEEFCDSVVEGIDYLGRVLERIMFYSALPLAVRKTLVGRATAQFTDYVSTLMDVLPTKAVVVNRSILDNRKELSMSGNTNKVDDKSQAQGETANPATPQAEAPITRSEVAAIVQEAVTAALKAQAEAQKTEQRADAPPMALTPPPAQTPPQPAPENKPDAVIAALETVITRSIGGLSDALKGVNDRLVAMESATIVRSESADNATTQRTDGGRPDPFKGIFGTLGK